MANSKLTVSQLLAAGFSKEQIALLVDAGQVKKEAAAKLPLVGLVWYTAKGNGKTSVYARISTTGSEWGTQLVKLNEGNELNAEGTKRLTELANAFGDALENPVVAEMGNKDK
jgi:hypothetical protein